MLFTALRLPLVYDLSCCSIIWMTRNLFFLKEKFRRKWFFFSGKTAAFTSIPIKLN